MSIHLPDYRIGQQIFHSDRSAVYRAHRVHDGQPVIIKVLNEDYPEPRETARFKHEYRITRQLTGKHAIKAYSLLPCGHAWAMVLEDGGTSVNHQIASLSRDRLASLELAVLVVEALAEIHADGIIHKDINPSNIVWNRETNQVKIIDFGISSQLSNERLDADTEDRFEGTAAYMSPEQSGRVNRALDYRSDLYSLGATLFELFTGQPPFPGKDVLELVHAHIARAPDNPCDINPALPKPLGRLILKLLAKPAEDRYQSIYGLRHDLRRIQQAVCSDGQISDFTLATQERFDRLQIPEKLYGRDKALARMRLALDRAATGAAGALAIHGPSGIGKTALVREIHGHVIAMEGHFLSGKCDQFTQVPYASLLQALRPFLGQLSRSAEHARWRHKIEQALGDEAALLIKLLPELDRFVDTTAEPSTDSGSIETENRFFRLMRRLIGVFCESDHPLVLFLDDLQWADGNTLKLIHSLLNHPDTRHLVLLGAYRDDEIDAEHQLSRMLTELESDGKLAERIEVTPLAAGHIAELLADTLHLTIEQTRPLAKICQNKTGGNPFFLSQFLHTLSKRRLLRFDPSAGHWQWDQTAIEQADITDNVITLMIDRLKELTTPCQRIVQYAACVGNRFDLRTLAVASGGNLQQVAEDLWPAVKNGLLVPMDSNYRLTGSDLIDAHSDNVHYRFLHDRVQQAAYAMLDAPTRRLGHGKIGHRLLQAWREHGETSNQLFDAVNHINLGDTPAPHAEHAELNRKAGNMAKASGAFGPALTYFFAALQRLPDDNACRGKRLDLSMNAAECAFLSGAINAGDELIVSISEQVQSPLERAHMRHLQVRVYTIIGRIREALDCALQGLSELGIALPEDDDAIIAETQTSLKAVLAGLPADDMSQLLNADLIRDETVLLQQQLLTDMGGAAYTLNARLYVLAYLKLTQLALEHGNSAWSAYGYATMASTLARMGDYSRADTLGQIAQDACYRFHGRQQLAKVRFIVGAFIRHWRHDFSDTRALLEQAFDDGLRSGDLLHANYALMFLPFCHWYGESPLSEVIDLADRYLAFSRHTDTAARQATVELARHAALNLCDRTENPSSLATASFDEALAWQQVNAAGAGICRVFKLQVLFIRGEHQAASQLLAEIEPRQPFFAGMMMEAGFVFFAALTLCQQARRNGQPFDTESQQRIDGYLDRMHKWADLKPAHFEHKHHLLQAERATLAGSNGVACQLYGQAIKGARARGFVASEAVACELAAAHYKRLELDDPANTLLAASYRAYRTWGAKAKAREMRGRHPGLSGKQHRTTQTGTLTGHFEQIDATSVIKACQAIASEIMLDNLLRRFMQIIIENAGARRGALLLDEGNDSLHLTATTHVNDGETHLFLDQPAPLSIREELPGELIEYVARTGQTLIKGRSQDDAILRQYLPEPMFRNCRSLLCLALLNQQRLVGVLLLENRLVEGVFKPEHIAVLELLAAQAGMSIINARLYSQMEHQVRSRTRELREKANQLESANRMLERLSITDPLTRLNNRRYLESRIENDVRQAIRLSTDHSESNPDRDLVFYLIDLDLFKQVNDYHGHDVGDRVLRQIARLMDDVFRETDYRVRWGGEEFLAVARFSDRRKAAEIAERLRQAVANEAIKLGDGSTLNVSCSIGFASLPFLPEQPNWLGWQQVLRLADASMYLAKSSGRNAWVGIEAASIESLDQKQWMLDNPEQATAQGWLSLQHSFSEEERNWS